MPSTGVLQRSEEKIPPSGRIDPALWLRAGSALGAQASAAPLEAPGGGAGRGGRAETVERLFYKVSIGGAPAGRLVAVEEKGEPSGAPPASTSSCFSSAPASSQSLGMQSRFVETVGRRADRGVVAPAAGHRRRSRPPTASTAPTIEIESRQGDNLVRRSVPNKEGWQTAAGGRGGHHPGDGRGARRRPDPLCDHLAGSAARPRAGHPLVGARSQRRDARARRPQLPRPAAGGRPRTWRRRCRRSSGSTTTARSAAAAPSWPGWT